MTLDLAALLPGVAVGDERQWQPAGAERTQELTRLGKQCHDGPASRGEASATTAARRGSAAPQRLERVRDDRGPRPSMSVRSRR